MYAKILGIAALIALVGCSSMPKPLFAPPAPVAEAPAGPKLVGVTEDELAAAALACGFPHAPEDTLRFCMENQGFRKDGDTISRATPERIAGERTEFERDLWMLQQLEQSRRAPPLPTPTMQPIVRNHGGGFTCSTLGTRATGIITCD